MSYNKDYYSHIIIYCFFIDINSAHSNEFNFIVKSLVVVNNDQ